MVSATLEADLYEADFLTWVGRQADLIRQRRSEGVDLEHGAEEIAGRSRAMKPSLRA